jgi:hypothetical protein
MLILSFGPGRDWWLQARVLDWLLRAERAEEISADVMEAFQTAYANGGLFLQDLDPDLRVRVRASLRAWAQADLARLDDLDVADSVAYAKSLEELLVVSELEESLERPAERAPTIKLMADYECFPLWSKDQGTNLDPASLSLSTALVRDLRAWADAYHGTLRREDPLASGFASEDDEKAFLAEGLRLARRVAVELGSGYHVEYFDGATTTKFS